MSNFDNKVNLDIAEIASKIMSPQKSTEMLNESTGDYSTEKAREGKDIGKPGKQFEKIAEKAGKKYGSEEKGKKVAGAVLAKLRKEGFSSLLDLYKNSGFVALQESLAEEVDNETFTKEVEENKKKASEKTKDDNGIAKAAVQAVKNEEQLNEFFYKLVAPSGEVHSKHGSESQAYNLMNSSPKFKDYKVVPVVNEDVIEEKELTPEEKAKKEEIVMSMKKKLGEFKKRYGSDRAKEVIYATATQKAKESA